jgi:hypothetical protein
MTKPLDHARALTYAGSLLSARGEIVAPYDLEVSGEAVAGFSPLPVHHAAHAPFNADFANISRVHLINAFGVTLGDSIIGLTALFALKRLHPHLAFTIYRPARAPRYVQRLYELASPLSGDVVELPVPLASLPGDALKIDIGNHLYWPRFAWMPMIDFFLWAMGVNPGDVPAHDKQNRWLRELPLPAVSSDPYVFLCATASTPVRSIPEPVRAKIVERMWDAFGLPVLGSGPVDHPRYVDISPQSPDTADFFAWVRHARHLVTSDTAALHVAAGFDVPATAIFTTIAARLRARDYPHCVPIELGLPHLQGVHASAHDGDLDALGRAYRTYDWRSMPFALRP